VSDDPAALLRARRLRVTPQRRAILGAFTGDRDEHLSADQVLARAGAAVPEIGRGTVYATLAELTELGLLSSVGTPEPVRYEVSSGAHDHFRCRLCQRLFDVELRTDTVAAHVPRGFAVESVRVVAHGVCAECRDYSRGLRKGAAAITREGPLDGAMVASLACTVQPSALGDLALAASEAGIVRVAFDHHADFEALRGRARSRRGTVAARKRLTALAGELERYLAGGRGEPTEPVDWSAVHDAWAPALRSTQSIAYGTLRSYERLESATKPYVCGQAMGANPVALLAPCHRVACGTSRPESYVGGAERLRFLQTLEAG
jgi:Fur family ferric uptake transcriptional regulator